MADFFSQQFIGNIGGADSISKHVFPIPVRSTSIRIRPLKYRNWICMRVELYGQGNHEHILNHFAFQLISPTREYNPKAR